MTISAKRFEFLDKTTNVPVTDFVSVTDSSIRNMTEADMKSVMDRISNMLNNAGDIANDGIKGLSLAAKNKLKDLGVTDEQMSKLFRNTTGVAGMMSDIVNMPNKLYDSLLDNMFPEGGMTKNLAREVFKVCVTAGQGNSNLRPFDVNLDCNGNSLAGGNGNCKPAGISNLLNALTNGAYGNSLSDVNSIINAATALALASYDANLCGGFNASIAGLNGNKTAINRAGILTMMGLAKTHSVRGTMEVLNKIDTKVVKNDYPEASKDIIGNPAIDKKYYGVDGLEPFKTQFGVDDRSIKDIYTGMLDGASLIDSNWNKADDGLLSISKVTDSSNSNVSGNTGFKSMSNLVLNNNTMEANQLNVINNNDNDTFNIVYATL